MLLNPIKLELYKVKMNIISIRDRYDKLFNIVYIENFSDENKTYVYLNENNELKIIASDKLENNSTIDKYKFIKKDDIAGIIIKYKKDLKFDLIINNKLFHINKVFINWYMNNTSEYDSKIIPFQYKHYQNIYDIHIDGYKEIGEYIYDSLLESITEYSLFTNFKLDYNKYLKYQDYLKYLYNKGFSIKTLVYLHKHSFDNITGIKCTYRNIEDEELIDSLNNIAKKLIKKI